MRTAIAIHSLSSGGAERVAVSLSEGLLVQGGEVMILTSDVLENDFYEVPSQVVRRSIGPLPQAGPLQLLRRETLRLRRLKQKILDYRPDVVISFMPIMNVRVLWLLRKAGIPVVVTEHAVPASFSELPYFWNVLRRFAYGKAAFLVSVSQGVDSHFDWLKPEQRRVIHNPLPGDIDDLLQEEPHWLPPSGRQFVLSMGRLHPQKGMDILIEAFAQVANRFNEHDLVILGEGAERQALEAQIATAGLEGRVYLPGTLRNPFPTVQAADAFVLSSRYEGFGNVLAEAMACGVPVIAANCASGPAEIIQEEVNGLLVTPENPRHLAGTMERLLGDSSLRASLSQAGRTSSARYGADMITREWVQLLTRVVDGG